MPHTIHSIRRDPFARASLMREYYRCNLNETCSECGQVRRTVKGRRYLWLYHWEPDRCTITVNNARNYRPFRAFCSVQCFETFYS